ncbi:helix-turn-helix domain-containing protein [Streptomyces sp. RB6PN25]|uniref:Helix-turn-helix domain-containing protein n=1 Tax=Streptomyces humicola TaxID=2953240 RepID=A0ABT1PQF9_9ACTN|nr:helix-turn-helix domain-containing protein [Streptomyces humicola]MCQ4079909.1 helix-turn-helix domain-containing protein [Streptomyces humicola]
MPRLRPPSALTPKRGERPELTLLAWLQTNRGSAPEVAAGLGIHPQTARRRLRRVQRLFAVALIDPDARFELEVSPRGRLNRLSRPP